MILRLATDRLLESVATGTDNFIFLGLSICITTSFVIGKREEGKEKSLGNNCCILSILGRETEKETKIRGSIRTSEDRKAWRR